MADTPDLRVLIADDQPLMSGALRLLVDSTPGLSCVGVVGDGIEAVEACAAVEPDVVLMDMQMPRMDGVEATRRITRAHPATRVLAITTFTSEDYLVPALRAGAGGYLLKDAEPVAVVSAIRAVHRGESVLSPVVAQKLLASVERDRPIAGPTHCAPGDPDGSDLSEREREVLELLARGRSNPEIAAALCISESTVKTNLGRIMDKLEVRDRVQVLIRAAQLGLVTLSLD
ncbi:response regulator transcription factor [Micrococcus sp.]|uniref:response regulator transcription factor n=1 Tax=Micrococcus sp. TaxID=1271 RepID=UPI002A91C697|nr:response regulator transcription factor [Micrococcus sp.]MDY6056085.1 response regulator transcription factor [Micrococcus sp.]